MPVKILVVDDEKDVFQMFKQVFEKEIYEGKFELVNANDGEEAYNILENNLDIEIILTDINMPEMDGLTLLSKIRKLNPLYRVVVITAYGDMKNIREAMNLGAYDFIIKPINLKDLRNTVRKTVEELYWTKESFLAIAKNTVLQASNRRLYEEIQRRKKIETELAATLEKLKTSNNDLQQFAYSASHDLQEPLRMINSYIQLIQQRYKDKLDSDANEFIHFIVDGAHRMQNLIYGLLEFSRVGIKGKIFEEIDLTEVVVDAIKNLSTNIQNTSTQIDYKKLPTVVGDKSQLISLFQNVIGNGIKFQKDGNTPLIKIHAKKQDNIWQIAISDNGLGIAEDYLEKIFVVFQRLHTHTEYTGTGIGLAICKRIVERHKGQIWVESKLSKGSVFYFTLPAPQ